ncbi:MAG: TIGR03619 family F420-dependent LLM class oxidoreductase [Acidimicrobiales bacterium]|nr:TIGR03619 family F420-dependent LLM class oxidoreductase [Acidimicrobiales bacterium]MYI28029.1 TIGR03619 family F420-dependent LLM class oxidoreductase [Acidimicrobiales bacterium]
MGVLGDAAGAEGAGRIAVAAEQAGFESVWTGEHVVLPDPQAPPSPLPPLHPMLDPAVALAYVAALTSEIKLGTGIIIVPQRNPLVLAKELASVDVLSGGRLLFGVGVGYLGPEFDALGIPMEDRARRTEEYIEAMRAIWSMDEPAYDGEFVKFSNVQARPRPVQQPGPPVVMGGHTAPAYRRSVTMSEGWYGFALDYDATQRCIDGLSEAGAHYDRPAELGRLEITVTPRVRPTPEMVERFAEMGVDRLVLLPNGQTVDEIAAFVDHIGTTILN